MNEFNKHKKADKIKWILTGVAFLLNRTRRRKRKISLSLFNVYPRRTNGRETVQKARLQ